MHVNSCATLRAAAGSKTADVSVPLPTTVRTELEAVTRERPELMEQIWRAPDELYEHIRVFVNGRDSSLLPPGLETALGAQDTLDVFPPVGGGQAASSRPVAVV